MTDAKKRKKVLLIDDSRLIHGIVYNGLGEDRDVIWAQSGVQAKELLEKDFFDLILLDLILPDVEEFELLKMIRANSKYDQVPVIILSAQSDSSTIEKGLAEGANDYLIKQFSVPELRARIQTQFRLQELNAIFVDVKRIEAVKSLAITFRHEIINLLSNISANNDLLARQNGEKAENKKIEVNISKIMEVLSKVEGLNVLDMADYTGSLPETMIKI